MKTNSFGCCLILIFTLYSCSQVQVKRGPSSWYSCFDNLKRILRENKQQMVGAPVNFRDVEVLNDLDSLYANESMFSWQARLSEEEIIEANRVTKELLRDAQVPQGVETFGAETIDQISKREADILYQDMTDSPCVRNLNRYNQPGTTIGYCFGKATLVHMTAIMRGVNPHSIKKIWIVGETTGWWGHHVATIIRGTNGKWWAIDKDAGKAITVDKWISKFGAKKENKELMVFATNPERFGPENSNTYNTFDLFNTPTDNLPNYQVSDDYYKGFFRDIFMWLDGNSGITRF